MNLKMPLLVGATALILAGCGATGPLARANNKVATPSNAHGTAIAKAPDPAKFFAHAEIEAQAPGAFALQAESLPFLKAIEQQAVPKRNELVKAIQASSALSSAITHFPHLDWAHRLSILKQVMALESQVMGFTQPPLVVQEGVSNREAFFEFDPAQGGTGKVFLYPDGLAKDANPYAALLLLIHETRHSYQFQLAFAPDAKRRAGPLAPGFKAAFLAQKQLSGKLSFCDFCSLLNEYEAFQSANYIVGAVSEFQADTSGMGCWSSQFDATGKAKIDLLALSLSVGPAKLLDAFNELEKGQFQEQ